MVVSLASTGIEFLLSFPICPHPALNFNWLIKFESCKKASLDITQAAETEGKIPHLFSSGKSEDASALIVAVNKYLSLYP